MGLFAQISPGKRRNNTLEMTLRAYSDRQLSARHSHSPPTANGRVRTAATQQNGEVMAALGADSSQRLWATTLALAKALCETRGILSRIVATTLAIETVNGIAKTAPVTDAAMTSIVENQKSKVGE
jgi:hypothetical protein